MKSYYHIVLVCAVLLLNACRNSTEVVKPTETENLPKSTWIEHAEVKFDLKFMNTAKVAGNKLYVAGGQHLLTFNENHQLERAIKINDTGDLRKTPAISNKIIAYHDIYSKTVALYSLENPQISKVINIEADVPEGYAMDEGMFTSNASIAINDSEQLLVKIRKKVATKSDTLAFLLYQTNITSQSITAQKQKEVYILTGYEDYSAPISQILSYKQNFYVSAQYNGAYLVNALGEHEKIANTRFAYPVQLQDSLVIAGHSRDWRLNYSLKPATQSFWGTVELDFEDNGYMSFTGIQNRFIGYRGDYILQFFVDLQQNKWQAKKLDTEGLTPSIIIKNLLVFKDKIYIVSLNGVFSKNSTDFFTYKPS